MEKIAEPSVWAQFGLNGLIIGTLFLLLGGFGYLMIRFFISQIEMMQNRFADQISINQRAFIECIDRQGAEANDRHRENIEVQRENISAISTMNETIKGLYLMLDIRVGGQRRNDIKNDG